MVWLWGGALILILALAGFVVGGMLGAATVPEGAGLAGGATVFLWAAGGAAIFVVAGVMLVRRVAARRRRR